MLLYSCSSEQRKVKLQDKQEFAIKKPIDTLKAERVKKIFYALPRPLEITMMFKKEGVEYPLDLLHTVAKIKDYSTSIAKSLN